MSRRVRVRGGGRLGVRGEVRCEREGKVWCDGGGLDVKRGGKGDHKVLLYLAHPFPSLFPSHTKK